MISEADNSFIQNGSKNFKIVFRSKTQEHGFNYPYQIGTNGNDPQLAEESSVPVLPGDMVILGTDGLFDNLYSISILKTIENILENKKEDLIPDKIAEALAKVAFDLSLEENYFSPFSMNAILNLSLIHI